jgi:adenosylcobinamide-GDP ribazoletransferase
LRAIPDIVAAAGESLRAATGFLTRLPVRSSAGEGFLVRAAAAFPVVGAGVGLAAALAAVAVLTGALHEDGLADFCDGVGGGKDRHDRLRIMRDSHIGAFGTLALILAVGLRASLIAAVAVPGGVTAAMIAAGAASRALLPTVMTLVPPARVGGLAAAAGKPGPAATWIALGVAALAAWLCLGFAGGLAAIAAAGAATAAVALLAHRTLGGQTGDVLGACQQAAEIAVLAVAGAMAAAS